MLQNSRNLPAYIRFSVKPLSSQMRLSYLEGPLPKLFSQPCSQRRAEWKVLEDTSIIYVIWHLALVSVAAAELRQEHLHLIYWKIFHAESDSEAFNTRGS